MTKFEFVKKVTKNLRDKDLTISENTTRFILNEILDAIVSEVSNGTRVKLVDFGVFEPRSRKRKIGRNPRNSAQEILIPAKTLPKFTAGKLFKESVIEAHEDGEQHSDN